MSRAAKVVSALAVDDLTERVEAQVRVTVPFVTTALAGLATVVLCAWVEPAAGVVVGALVGFVLGRLGYGVGGDKLQPKAQSGQKAEFTPEAQN